MRLPLSYHLLDLRRLMTGGGPRGPRGFGSFSVQGNPVTRKPVIGMSGWDGGQFHLWNYGLPRR